jgi:N-succinyldiaminopimelate aminotransferase
MRADPLVDRMRGFGTTIFAEMTALAQETGAINLGQGFPDTDGPPSMLAAAARAITDGVNQYPPGRGMPTLRAALSRHRHHHYGLDYDPDSEILVTVGATEGISAGILALCEAGDEVIVLEPYYDSYAAAITLAGATRVPVPLRPESSTGRFGFDPDELRAAVTRRTRLVLVNSPHNPTGTVLTNGELASIAQVCLDHDLIALTDEVYEHLTYDDIRHVPLATLPGMRERTVSVSSAGKTFSVTGWKIGWVCAPATMIRAVSTVKQFTTFTHSGPMQLAVAAALDDELPWVERQRLSLQDRRDRLVAGINSTGMAVHPPQATYFVQADTRPLGITDAVELARRLPHEAGVVAIPTGAFCDTAGVGDPYLRFAFCKRDEVLDEAIRRLTDFAVTTRS